MTEEPIAEETADGVKARRSVLGCLGRIVIGVVGVIALIVVVGLIFDQGDSADQPQDGVNAGTAEEYARADVNQFEQEHVLLTRLQDGEFMAFYDKSPRQQELGGTCRVLYDETAQLGTLEQLPAMRGAFVEDCNNTRTVWRLDGTFAFGAGYGNLDRYNVKPDANGDLIIFTDSRTCTRSRGVPGIPPYEERVCGRGD